MIIKVIDWERKTIEEIEIAKITYEEDGLSIWRCSDGHVISVEKIGYQNFLGTKED